MVTALYRRYRPETFAELIGQQQVTAPLMTALRTDRVNHAYLFSGPRGCGKTTSARILARCLNCAEGPTDTPCGKCPSCIELSRDGSGSLDVVEIDAASHNGVDDARELRERAIFAPARDRFKIFILDEAHMVTPQGFNALLKIVEEPPAHVKFIFATTEPEKVIGTIRSRTHHYPFRLVPPAQMLEYLEQLCASEGVEVAPGVLPLVIRAGGGSVRDSLSLLDQLIAGSDTSGSGANGSEAGKVEYDLAVSLLGYTHTELLNSVVDAFATRDAAAVFEGVDKVIQTGQDPRRFVEDLLEHIRNLIIVASANESAKNVLHGIPADEIDKMAEQAYRFGLSELTYSANVISHALSEMGGATSPRLHLELMCARVLVPASDVTEVGSLARLERLERRIGIAAVGESPSAAPAARPQVSAVVDDEPAVLVSAPVEPVKVAAAVKSEEIKPEPVLAQPAAPTHVGEVTSEVMIATWPQILNEVSATSKPAWVLVAQLKPLSFIDEVLTLQFKTAADVESFKNSRGAPDILRSAITSILGVTVKFKPAIAPVITEAEAAAVTAAINVVVAEAEVADEVPAEALAPLAEEPAIEEPIIEEAPVSTKQNTVHEGALYGESLLRDVLGAVPVDKKK